MTLWSIAFSLFLLMDAIGNIPFYISFLKHVDIKRRPRVIFREMLIALFVILIFVFAGEGLMTFLNVRCDTIQIAGGIILFLICLKMIFPPSHSPNDELPHEIEPFIVPLAVPLIAGPSVLAAVMIYSQQELHLGTMILAVILAWIASLVILLSSSWFQSFLGWRGIVALERLMGLILTLIAVQMFLTGISSFVSNLPEKGTVSECRTPIPIPSQ